MKKQQLLVINYLLRLKAIIFAASSRRKQLNNTTDDNFTFRFRRKRTCICMENDSKSTLRYAFVAPGNAGTAAIANVDVSITDFEAIKVFVLAEKVEMIVVGPEDPLVKGIYDFF
jgi:hypothetical protein